MFGQFSAVHMARVAYPQLVEMFDSSLGQYADNMQLCVALTDTNSMPELLGCLHAVNLWLNVNGLSENNKTKNMPTGMGPIH